MNLCLEDTLVLGIEGRLHAQSFKRFESGRADIRIQDEGRRLRRQNLVFASRLICLVLISPFTQKGRSFIVKEESVFFHVLSLGFPLEISVVGNPPYNKHWPGSKSGNVRDGRVELCTASAGRAALPATAAPICRGLSATPAKSVEKYRLELTSSSKSRIAGATSRLKTCSASAGKPYPKLRLLSFRRRLTSPNEIVVMAFLILDVCPALL